MYITIACIIIQTKCNSDGSRSTIVYNRSIIRVVVIVMVTSIFGSLLKCNYNGTLIMLIVLLTMFMIDILSFRGIKCDHVHCDLKAGSQLLHEHLNYHRGKV